MSDNYMIDVPQVITSREDFDQILNHAVNHDCSDIVFDSDDPIRMKRHGRNINLTNRNIQHHEIARLVETSYGQNGISFLGSGQPLNYKLDIPTRRHEKIRFRVNGTKSESGYRLVLRVIPEIPPSIETLGVDPDIMTCVQETRQGVIFVCGATGNGKSTLLASILRHQLENESNHNIVTYESPIEFTYHRINKGNNMISQHEIGLHIPSFGDGVINAMRQAPTTILIGESRDHATISASLEASLTGHQVYTTLHTTDVSKTLPRVISMFPLEIQQREKSALIDATCMILCQRLVPTVDNKRAAIREYLIFDDAIRDQIRCSKDINQTVSTLLKQTGHPFIRDLEALHQEKRIDALTFKKFKD